MSTGEEDSKKEQKTKKNKKKDEDRESEGTTAMCGLARSNPAQPGPEKGLTGVLCPSDGSEGGRVSRTVLERWRESLQSCTSLSQVSPKLCSDWLRAHQRTLTRSSLGSGVRAPVQFGAKRPVVPLRPERPLPHLQTERRRRQHAAVRRLRPRTPHPLPETPPQGTGEVFGGLMSLPARC